ncbi:MAG TPA: glycosyltransferase family 2 protein [Kiritimatiellia bacterium]|nr:glycosyltransferase family 2 protein [Kiritimatiellia bacterium]
MNEYRWIDQKRWVRRTLSRLRMRRLDTHTLPGCADEVRLFTVMRNEMLRLPAFFAYYRDIGVRRFFIVDNASDDGTTAFLLTQPDAHVWSTSETYTRQEAWVDVMLRRFGRDGWSVVIDVDELLVWPGQGTVSLSALLAGFDAQGADAMHALLLDMYPQGPLRDATYTAGDPFLPAAPWFDPDSHDVIDYPYRRCVTEFPKRFVGGMRERVFGLKDVCLSKFPLIRYRPGMFLRQGTHAVEGAHIARTRGCILHFKYLGDFGPRVQYEAVRGEHWNGAVQYKAYAQKVGVDPGLAFHGPHSVRFENPAQLVHLGLMAG